MKSMTCNELGGACDVVFKGDTFSEIAAQSKKHGSEMIQKKDPDHLEAMRKMQDLMKTPNAMQEWMESKNATFNALPEL